MSTLTQDGAVVLRLEDSLDKEHAAEHAKGIATALGQVGAGGVLRIESPFPEGPDACGLAVLIAAGHEARSRSVELHLSLPRALSELVDDLRLGKHAVVEVLEVQP